MKIMSGCSGEPNQGNKARPRLLALYVKQLRAAKSCVHATIDAARMNNQRSAYADHKGQWLVAARAAPDAIRRNV